ncbi:MAG: hypothetical protein V1927_00960 [Candidatus Omnitrophota bacterium]
MKNGCSVIDFTPCAQKFDSYKLTDLIAKYRASDDIKAFFVFYYQLFSRVGYRGNYEYGLFCNYNFALIDAVEFSILFYGSGSAYADVPSMKGTWGVKHSEAPVRWVDTSNEKNKIGVMDESWLETNMLHKFTKEDAEVDAKNAQKDNSRKPFLVNLKEDFECAKRSL